MFAVCLREKKGIHCIRSLEKNQGSKRPEMKQQAHEINLFQFSEMCKDFEMTIAFSETKFSYRRSYRCVHIPNWDR
jgi:hypothetical protein